MVGTIGRLEMVWAVGKVKGERGKTQKRFRARIDSGPPGLRLALKIPGRCCKDLCEASAQHLSWQQPLEMLLLLLRLPLVLVFQASLTLGSSNVCICASLGTHPWPHLGLWTLLADRPPLNLAFFLQLVDRCLSASEGSSQ